MAELRRATAEEDPEQANAYWTNLIGPDPMAYTGMVDIVASEHGM